MLDSTRNSLFYLGGGVVKRALLVALVIMLLFPVVLGGQREDGQRRMGLFLSQTQESPQQFTATCHIEAWGMLHVVTATMDVEVEFRDRTFTYRVLKESGYEPLRTRLILGALRSEKARLETNNPEEIAFSNQNYSFSLGKTEKGLQGLLLIPRHDNKFLPPGTLFVDGRGTLVRSRVRPTKIIDPSIHSVVIETTYKQISGVSTPIYLKATGKFKVFAGGLEVQYSYRSVNGTEFSGAK